MQARDRLHEPLRTRDAIRIGEGENLAPSGRDPSIPRRIRTLLSLAQETHPVSAGGKLGRAVGRVVVNDDYLVAVSWKRLVQECV
jgi:hypothetical protein